MKKGFILGAFIFILLVFFSPILIGKVPFPGDLLLSHYEPFRSYSYNGFLPGSIPSKNQGADAVRELYPWKHFSIDQIKQGIFPLWNPYNFAGNPSFANLQSGLFNPINVLFFIVPFYLGWTGYIVFQYILILIFTYLYLRTIKLSVLSSLFGALSFSFSGFLVVWGDYGVFGYSLMWLPLILLSVEKFISESRMRWLFLMCIFLTLSIFAGYIQISLYIFILTFIYSATRAYYAKIKLKKFVSLMIFLVAPFFITAVQLLPMYEFVKLSFRVPYTFSDLSGRLNPISNIITILIPDFFGNPATGNYFAKGSVLEQAAFIGVWPAIFAVYAIFTKNTFTKRFFTITAGLTYLSTLAILPIIYLQSIGIPFLSTGVPTRILCIFCFSIAVLAGIGVDEFSKATKRDLFYKVAAIFAVIFALLFFSTYINTNLNSLVSRRNILIPALIFIAGIFIIIIGDVIMKLKTKRIPPKLVLAGPVIIIFLITTFDLFYSFHKFTAFVPASYIYPPNPVFSQINKIQGIDRYWGYGSAEIDPNLQLEERNYTPEGYDALYIKKYGQFLSGSKSGRLQKNIEHTQALIFPGYGPSDLKQNPYRQRALNLLGVKYVLNKSTGNGIDSAFDAKIYKLIWEDNNFQIYKNLNSLPRISIFGNYIVENIPAETIKKLYSKNFDYKNKIILDKKVSSSYKIQKDNDARIENLNYSTNEIKFKTTTRKDSLVFVSDNYYPGWKVDVDGINTPLYIADYTFRAVPVHAGIHNIRFYYEPESFSTGLLISFISCLLIIVSASIIIRRYVF